MHVARFLAVALIAAAASAAQGQSDPSVVPTPLSELLTEAVRDNSQITAADYARRAASSVPQQVSTLPDPTFTFQLFSVGSPKPFAGYTNSNFSYVGLGASQELPYPGKLRLRGEVAKQAVDVLDRELGATTAGISDEVKADYLQLAYLQKTLVILTENERVLDQLLQDATARYKVGQGLQADVLQAQVERTKIVRELTAHHEQTDQIEAHLKGLLHRDQGSPDIVTEVLVEDPLRLTSTELLQRVQQKNPQIQVDSSSVSKGIAALVSARRESKPDFGLAYMYQQNDRKYRDYYMFTLNIKLPRKARVNAEVAEAAAKLAESKETLDSHLQQQLAQVKRGYATAASDEELLKEYDQGLIPQSEAAYRATLNGYASNRDQFTHVLLYFVNLLGLRLDEAQVLEEHEIALAHLETLTGATLR